MFNNFTCLSSNYSLCTKIYSSLIQKIPCKLPEDGDIIAPKRVGAMQKTCMHKLYKRGYFVVTWGWLSQGFVDHLMYIRPR